MAPIKSASSAAALGGMSLALFFLLACAGDDDPNARYDVVVDTGLAPDKTLISLTDEQALTVCAATADAADEIISHERALEVTCTIASAALSVVKREDGRLQLDVELCERTRDACVMNASTSKPVANEMCELHPMRRSTGAACTATVAEYEECVTAALHAAWDTIGTWDCAFLAEQPIATIAELPLSSQQLDVPACDDFEAKCGALPVL